MLYLTCAAFNIILGGFCSPEHCIDDADLYPDPLKRLFIYTNFPLRYSLRYYSKLRRRTKIETVSELRTLPSNRRCSIFLLTTC